MEAKAPISLSASNHANGCHSWTWSLNFGRQIDLIYQFYNFLKWLSLCVDECRTLKIHKKWVRGQHRLYLCSWTWHVCPTTSSATEPTLCPSSNNRKEGFRFGKQRIKASLVYKVHLDTSQYLTFIILLDFWLLMLLKFINLTQLRHYHSNFPFAFIIFGFNHFLELLGGRRKINL